MSRKHVECIACEKEHVQDYPIHIEEQGPVLPEFHDLDAIKALVPLTDDDPETEDKKKFYKLLTGSDAVSSAGNSLNDIDGGVPPQQDLERMGEFDPHVADMTPTFTDVVTSMYEFGSGRVVTLTLSCLAASVALGCLLVMLYVKHLFGHITPPSIPRDGLSILEKQEFSDLSVDDTFNDPDSGGEKLGLLFLNVETPQPGNVVIASDDETLDEKTESVDYASSDEEDLNDMDEKFHDAEPFASPLVRNSTTNLPRIEIEYADPDLLPLPILSTPTPYSTPPHTPPRSTLRRLPSHLSMRALSSPTPAWSLRASDAPALGLSSSPSSQLVQMRAVSPEPVSIPGAFVPDEQQHQQTLPVEQRPRSRAYRSPMPELDLAFAMQLRPGLGLGSDPAWFVRFLMAMFGWMTVLLGSSGASRSGLVNQRAIAA